MQSSTSDHGYWYIGCSRELYTTLPACAEINKYHLVAVNSQDCKSFHRGFSFFFYENGGGLFQHLHNCRIQTFLITQLHSAGFPAAKSQEVYKSCLHLVDVPTLKFHCFVFVYMCHFVAIGVELQWGFNSNCFLYLHGQRSKMFSLSFKMSFRHVFHFVWGLLKVIRMYYNYYYKY